MTAEMWEKIFTNLPTAGILLVAVIVFLRYVDKWVGQIAAAKESGAQERQQQIIVLLERVQAATASLETKMSGVIERNTQVIDTTNTTLLRVCETLAALTKGQDGMESQLTDLSATMLKHYQDVAARPCQMPKRSGAKTG